MSPLKASKTQIRASIDTSLYNLLKGLSGVKQMSMSDLVSEAIERYLEDEDNQELIEYHRLGGSDSESSSS